MLDLLENNSENDNNYRILNISKHLKYYWSFYFYIILDKYSIMHY